MFRLIAILGVLSLLTAPALAEVPGHVQIPIETYHQIVGQYSNSQENGYAVGSAEVEILGTKSENGIEAAISAVVRVEVFESKYVNINLLPPGTSLVSANVSGKPVELISLSSGLVWRTKKQGSHLVSLKYIASSNSGLTVPTPKASSTRINATLPVPSSTLSVFPSQGLRVSNTAAGTTLSGNIPSTNFLNFSWTSKFSEKPTLSRAIYRGTLEEKGIRWEATFESDPRANYTNKKESKYLVSLISDKLVLENLQVNDIQVPIIAEDGFFKTEIDSSSRQSIKLTFHTPLGETGSGVNFPVPRIPVSIFEIELDGSKAIEASPRSEIRRTTDSEESTGNGKTKFRITTPMTEQIAFNWTEAIPEDVEEELRASATIYNHLHAMEGVLFGKVYAEYDITRGETSKFSFEIPKGIDVTAINSNGPKVVDWTIDKGDLKDQLNVYLANKVDSGLMLQVSYDRSVKNEAFNLGLFYAVEVSRQRGMLALLKNKELTIDPLEIGSLSPVGENQLPNFIREKVDMTVAHTYKYSDKPGSIKIQAKEPEKQAGKFDSSINTLISVGDVILKGSAEAKISVKAGAISELEVEVPESINVLNVTAPSLRGHKVVDGESGKRLKLEFTRDMDGQFRFTVEYEKILADKITSVKAPILKVVNADVAHGKLGVEALSAVEINAKGVQELSTIDPKDLPKQLILKTSNPILLAYKYVKSGKPYALNLDVKRHKEVTVNVANIDWAQYSTLYTSDGSMINFANFFIRNSQEQFLRIALPKGSKIWSVHVNGEKEKPAWSEESKEFLVKILNSEKGFEVKISYMLKAKPFSSIGILKASLPVPNMVVGKTTWEVFLPKEMQLNHISSNMEQVGTKLDRNALMKSAEGLPVDISLINSGQRLAFQKLFASQSSEKPEVSFLYSQGWARCIPYLILVGLMILIGAKLFRSNPLVCLILIAGLFGLGTMTLNLTPIGLLLGLLGLVSSFVNWKRTSNHSSFSESLGGAFSKEQSESVETKEEETSELEE